MLYLIHLTSWEKVTKREACLAFFYFFTTLLINSIKMISNVRILLSHVIKMMFRVFTVHVRTPGISSRSEVNNYLVNCKRSA